MECADQFAIFTEAKEWFSVTQENILFIYRKRILSKWSVIQ